MHLKKRLISVAAVVAMAAALFYGSTLKMAAVQEEEHAASWFEKTDTIYFWYSDDAMTNFISSAAVTFGEREGVRVIPVLNEESEYLETLNQASLILSATIRWRKHILRDWQRKSETRQMSALRKISRRPRCPPCLIRERR